MWCGFESPWFSAALPSVTLAGSCDVPVRKWRAAAAPCRSGGWLPGHVAAVKQGRCWCCSLKQSHLADLALARVWRLFMWRPPAGGWRGTLEGSSKHGHVRRAAGPSWEAALAGGGCFPVWSPRLEVREAELQTETGRSVWLLLVNLSATGKESRTSVKVFLDFLASCRILKEKQRLLLCWAPTEAPLVVKEATFLRHVRLLKGKFSTDFTGRCLFMAVLLPHCLNDAPHLKRVSWTQPTEAVRGRP